MKSIILLSGGLDSATTLYYAKDKGHDTHCLIFDYGQRHKKEIKQARKLAAKSASPYYVVKCPLPWGGSALLDKAIAVPTGKEVNPKKIPATYVPARNIIFLSVAASFAEAIGAGTIFIGANALDYSGYPDCRPAFFDAYQKMLKQGLKAGVEGKGIVVKTPLVEKSKAQIIKMGIKLKVPYQLTWSCYQGGRGPCGRCDSCQLRAKGFAEAGVADPLLVTSNKKERPELKGERE